MEFSKKFVCEDLAYSTYEKNIPAPLFRKSFMLDKKVDSTEILICGLGFYDLFINGEKITKGYLAPYISNTDHYVYYDKYDLLPWLHEGENVIGVMLGDGFCVGKTLTWRNKDNITNYAPRLALSAEIVCPGSVISFEADDFVCKKGPIIFNDFRSGVFYDARLEEAGWNDAGFAENGWHAPIIADKPRGTAKLCSAEPITAYREIKPVSIKRGELAPYICSDQVTEFNAGLSTFETKDTSDWGYIYDFGENNSGIYRLKIKGNAGQKISIQCAEQLTDGRVDYSNINFFPDGFSQRDIYYLKGGEEEVFEPMFTFHGYRYIYISGITPEQATEDLLTYLAISSELKSIGSFDCSDEAANGIYQMGRRSDISNFFYFPLDCPHREKNGWTGDAAVSAEHMVMTISAENSWREWLCNIRKAQREDGSLPGVVPTGAWGYDAWRGIGYGPLWDGAIIIIPCYMHKYRGNKQVIAENAAAILRYLEYMSKIRNSKGYLDAGLGDHLPPSYKDKEDKPGDWGRDFLISAAAVDLCRKAEAMFDIIGLNMHSSFARTLKEEMLYAVRKEFIKPGTYIADNRSQTAQAAALYFDIFTEEEKQRAFDVLLNIIKEDGEHFTCGMLGLRVLFHVLSEFNHSELAYKMITQETFPAYGYWLKNGETTLLEQFIETDGYYPASKNHHFMGDVVNWFMRYPGGLNVQDSQSVKVSPCFIKKLDWCKTAYELPNGKIEIFWERKDGGIELRVACSGDVTYEVDVPCEYTRIGDGVYKVYTDR